MNTENQYDGLSISFSLSRCRVVLALLKYIYIKRAISGKERGREGKTSIYLVVVAGSCGILAKKAKINTRL